MPYDIDTEPVIITVPAQATAPVNDIPAPEWTDLKNRIAAVEGLGLVDLSDIDLTDLDDGMLLIWDEGDQLWKPGEMSDGTIARVSLNHSGSPSVFNVSYLTFGPGMNLTDHGTRAHIDLTFGSAANTVAEGNHRHTQPLPVRVTTAPSGYMSGGSRSLGSTSVTLANGIPYVVEADLYGQLRGADSGAAYYTLSITIGSNTFTSPGGSEGFWCVQGVPDKIKWKHERKITGSGTSVPVSASVAYHSGAGFNVDRTYLDVRLRPER